MYRCRECGVISVKTAGKRKIDNTAAGCGTGSIQVKKERVWKKWLLTLMLMEPPSPLHETGAVLYRVIIRAWKVTHITPNFMKPYLIRVEAYEISSRRNKGVKRVLETKEDNRSVLFTLCHFRAIVNIGNNE